MSWERAERFPSLHQLRKLAKLVKQPYVALLLPEPPPEVPLPQDFRTLPGERAARGQSVALREANETAHQTQQVAVELATELEAVMAASLPHARLLDSPAKVATRFRADLGVTIDLQLGWHDHFEALRYWKNQMEARGLLVIQFSRVSTTEARGFCLTGPNYPVVALNSQDPPQARIFTLFHEIGHLILGGDGLCIPGSAGSVGAERWCDQFATNVLMPKDEVVALARGYDVQLTSARDLARKLHVSTESFIIRLAELGFVSEPQKLQLLREHREAGVPIRSGGGDYWRNFLSAQSRSFLELVASAKEAELLPTHKAALYAGIKASRWGTLMEKLGFT